MSTETQIQGIDLRGRNAVVIGGTSGIGKTLALGMARAGANVVPTGRREANIAEVCAEITAMGRKTLNKTCLLYTSPSPRDRQKSRMPSSA